MYIYLYIHIYTYIYTSLSHSFSLSPPLPLWQGSPRGSFVGPTVISGVKPHMRCCKLKPKPKHETLKPEP